MKYLVMIMLVLVVVSAYSQSFFDSSVSGFETTDLLNDYYISGFDVSDDFIWAVASNKLVKYNRSNSDITEFDLPEDYFGSGVFGSFVFIDDNKIILGFTSTGNTDDRIYEYDVASNLYQLVCQFTGNFDCEKYGDEYFISGLNGESGNSIWLLDPNGNHDKIIETGGFSCGLAVDSSGNIYYAGELSLYKFSREQIVSAFGESFLSLGDGEILSSLEESAYDVETDDSNNVFFNGNGTYSYTAIWNGNIGTDINYDYIGLGCGEMGDWFGYVKANGSYNSSISIFQADAYYFGLAEAKKIVQDVYPQAPALSIIHKNAVLNFDPSSNIFTGVSSDLNASEPENWISNSTVTLSDTGLIKVFAKSEISDKIFTNIYDVREAYAPQAGMDGSTAVYKNDSEILSWATSVHSVNYGANVDPQWQTPEKALGQAEGTSMEIVCLGEGGNIVLEFEPSIVNGDGFDFCVFENGFAATYLELAKIAVSSDGENFVEFDCSYIGDEVPLAESIGQIAGKYMQGYGTPFDLEVLKNKPEVTSGSINLQNIKYVKVIDIVGDGNTTDSFGNIIYDPYPGSGAAGFDLDAIGVMNNETVSSGDEPLMDFNLVKNYPNPFNPETTLEFFSASSRGDFKVEIFNTQGQNIRTYENNKLVKGINRLKLNLNNCNSGIYYYRVSYNGGSLTSSMLLLK
ncbi:MAG: T9SS type A sorting domain-containing protein [Candidatus Delongbacteria bacterium]|nr:T9SS type A sorting domain-containing protein [Candidatus Delongbacteria bacterium]